MSKPIGYISIDPGATGGMCCLIPSTKRTIFFDLKDATPAEIAEWFGAITVVIDAQLIMIERVSSIFGASAGSNFKFGYNVGVVNALAEASLIGVSHVPPKTWQKNLGVTKKGKAIKKNVAELVRKLYPDAEIYGPKGGLKDGRSDALGIAYYNYIKHTGTK